MPLAPGVATSGKTGSTAIQSLEAGGVLRYIPNASFGMIITRGDSLVPLRNNAAFSGNKVLGTIVGRFTMALPLIPTATPADFFARAIGSVSGDTDISNYHKITDWPDNAGGAALTHSLCKFGTFEGQLNFSTNGAAQALGMRLTGLVVDPESGTATPLATPSAGALACGGVKGFAQSVITGATEVVGVSWGVSTGADITPGNRAGTNTKYPRLAKGVLQQDLTGTVTITQHRNAATVLGGDGSDGTLDIAVGSVGDGLGLTFDLMPIEVAKPSTQNINLITSRYMLKSVDCVTTPMRFRDL